MCMQRCAYSPKIEMCDDHACGQKNPSQLTLWVTVQCCWSSEEKPLKTNMFLITNSLLMLPILQETWIQTFVVHLWKCYKQKLKVEMYVIWISDGQNLYSLLFEKEIKSRKYMQHYYSRSNCPWHFLGLFKRIPTHKYRNPKSSPRHRIRLKPS